MRQLTLLILGCLLALSLAACGEDKKEETVTESTKAEELAAAPDQGATAVDAAKTDAAKPAAKPEAAKPKVPSVDAKALYDEYQKDSAAADKKWKDKVVRVTGTVWKVDAKDQDNGIPYVTFKTSSMFGSVICFFDKSQADKLEARFQPGKTATITGKCTGQKVGVQNVSLVDCSF